MTLRRAPVVLMSLLIAACTGCSRVGEDGEQPCMAGKVLVEPGSTFAAGDGCNTCMCGTGGRVTCTARVCEPPPACYYGGINREVGTSFPSTDGCNMCSCVHDGEMACTEIACAQDGGAPMTCMLDATYDFGPIGGRVAYVVRASLTPDGRFVYSSEDPSSTITQLPPSCNPALPTCGTPAAIDLADIAADLADPDVQTGFAATAPPVYGRDSRPVDGQVFEIKRASGGSLLVGDECPSPTLSSCRPIPPGIAKLADDLRTLIEQEIADPMCSFARRQ